MIICEELRLRIHFGTSRDDDDDDVVNIYQALNQRLHSFSPGLSVCIHV